MFITNFSDVDENTDINKISVELYYSIRNKAIFDVSTIINKNLDWNNTLLWLEANLPRAYEWFANRK